ncbi:bile acid:sodium symporter family protein [Akkermansiaceae bacterium]|nr:bile acid:sodium symporter family protein [Akkermansiaceae bacterium]
MASRAVNLFWLWTLVGVAWAWFAPGHFTWFLGDIPGTGISLISAGLGVIMLGMGMTLSFADFRECLKTPRWIALGVAAQFVIMPLAGWTVASLSGLPGPVQLGIILVSCCPGGTASNVVTYLARGNLALSVLMTMCSTFLAVGLTPFLTKAYASAILRIEAGPMIVSMVAIVLLPILVGLLLNRYLGKWLAPVKNVSPVVSVLVIVLIVSAVVGKTKPSIIEHWNVLLPAVFALHAFGFGLGYLWARLFGFPEKECRTVCIEVGMQNSGLGSSLANTHFTMLAAAPCAISAFFHCIIGSILASWWGRRQAPPDP